MLLVDDHPDQFLHDTQETNYFIGKLTLTGKTWPGITSQTVITFYFIRNSIRTSVTQTIGV